MHEQLGYLVHHAETVHSVNSAPAKKLKAFCQQGLGKTKRSFHGSLKYGYIYMGYCSYCHDNL